MNTKTISLAAAAVLLAGSALAADPAAPAAPARDEARIPFANHGGIYNWSAEGDSVVYVQDIHKQWYRADLLAPCIGLPYAVGIGFQSGPMDEFDRFSAVVVDHQKCPVRSFAKSAPPAPSAKHGKSGQDTPAASPAVTRN